MLVVIKAAVFFHQACKGGFARVTKRGMTDIVGKANGFHQIFIRAERASNRATNLSHFDGVGQAGAVIVAFVINKNLSLVLKPAKSRGVDNPFSVALEACAIIRLFFRIFPTT